MDFMKMFKLWIDAIHPSKWEKTLKDQKDKGSFLWDSVTIVAIAALISAIIGGIAGFIGIFVYGSLLGVPLDGAMGEIILGIPLDFIMTIIGFILVQYLVFFIAGALGGKGKLDQQAYPWALIVGGTAIAGAILDLISVAIPCLGLIIGGLGALVLGIWVLYLNYKLIKDIHKLDTLKAIVTLIGAIIVIAVISFVIIAVLQLAGLDVLGLNDPYGYGSFGDSGFY